MKKISFLVIITLVTVSLFAQTANKPEAVPMSDNLFALQTANNLARYGYSARSASALIGAAEIFVQIQTQAAGAQATRSGESIATTTDTQEYNPATLLADAKRFAGRDRTMTAWADEVQKALNARTRGAVGGPRQASDVVYGGGVIEYQLGFIANQRAEVLLSGSGVSDLDLYIFDSNGILICADEGYSDDAFASWIPAWTGSFTIVVKNWGNRANRFVIYTN